MLALPSLRAALAERDITKVYDILRQEGIPQRRIAELTGQSQSEVCEIIKGRQVWQELARQLVRTVPAPPADAGWPQELGRLAPDLAAGLGRISSPSRV